MVGENEDVRVDCGFVGGGVGGGVCDAKAEVLGSNGGKGTWSWGGWTRLCILPDKSYSERLTCSSAAAAAYPSCLESRTSWHVAQDAGAIGLESLICGTVSAQSIHEFSYHVPHAGHGYKPESRPTVSHFNVTGAS